MRKMCAGIPLLGDPVEFIEHTGTTASEDYANTMNSYFEMKHKVLLTFSYLFGVAALIFMTYVTYHVISKIRGNEKNALMNNFGIALALLPLVNYSVSFTNWATFTVVHD